MDKNLLLFENLKKNKPTERIKKGYKISINDRTNITIIIKITGQKFTMYRSNFPQTIRNWRVEFWGDRTVNRSASAQFQAPRAPSKKAKSGGLFIAVAWLLMLMGSNKVVEEVLRNFLVPGKRRSQIPVDLSSVRVNEFSKGSNGIMKLMREEILNENPFRWCDVQH